MASALKLLTRRGYRRIRVEDVAEDAGVSKATVYHYFANKDELLTRTVAGRIADKHAAIEQRLAAAGGTASDRLRLFLHQFWSMSLTEQAVALLASGCWSARSSPKHQACSPSGPAGSCNGGVSSSS